MRFTADDLRSSGLSEVNTAPSKGASTRQRKCSCCGGRLSSYNPNKKCGGCQDGHRWGDCPLKPKPVETATPPTSEPPSSEEAA